MALIPTSCSFLVENSRSDKSKVASFHPPMKYAPHFWAVEINSSLPLRGLNITVAINNLKKVHHQVTFTLLRGPGATWWPWNPNFSKFAIIWHVHRLNIVPLIIVIYALELAQQAYDVLLKTEPTTQ